MSGAESGSGAAKTTGGIDGVREVVETPHSGMADGECDVSPGFSTSSSSSMRLIDAAVFFADEAVKTGKVRESVDAGRVVSSDFLGGSRCATVLIRERGVAAMSGETSRSEASAGPVDLVTLGGDGNAGDERCVAASSVSVRWTLVRPHYQ